MKVLKFGGTSVGSVEGLANVKKIAESCETPAVIVVSAFSGVTQSLYEAGRMAAVSDAGFRDVYDKICDRHYEMIGSLISDAYSKKKLFATIQPLLEELKALYEGVFILKVLPDKTEFQIASMGERLSSVIIAELIEGAELHDSLKFIKTTGASGKKLLNSPLTEKLVREEFSGFKGLAVVPGFISTDSATGEITTLGRGGSDYTASIIAAALGAESLEIWTDVNGFMTADPRIINTSYVINELSFAEAMELCHFGAKVIYAPALYPVLPKDIPIYIKNTFNPSADGTVIRRECAGRDLTVTGISSINDTCLLTLSAPSMVGLVGVDGRFFGALTAKGISVFLVTQSSSETGISVGISADCIETARQAVNEEFEKEIAYGVMNPATVEMDLATVAVVGPDMKKSKGVAAKLFTTLSRNGIGVLACAQGSSEHNISIVVKKENLRKALNVIHDSFFLSEYQELNLFICGIGTVGGQLIEQLSKQRDKLMKERFLKLNVVGISRSRRSLFCKDGINLATYREDMELHGIDSDVDTLRREIIGMNIFNSVFVDCTASGDVAGLYKDFLSHGISVVAANKIAASSDYDAYQELKSLAVNHGAKYLFETNVGAGLPVINTINALKNSGDRIEKIEAVVSGTLNFIFNTISADIPFSRTVRMAMEEGFAEPDPRIDLSGKDVIRKLVILAREAGYQVSQDDVEKHLFVPAEFFEGPIENFWAKLPELDAGFEEERKSLAAQHKQWRFVARMDNGHYEVALEAVDEEHPFYYLEGSNNIFLLTTERYHKHPLMIQGYGAGASVTAAGVFADIMSIANI